MSRLAVLLRAINVGGAGKLAMADLKAALADLGCAQPRTLGAAGSAVVEASEDPTALETRIEADLKTRFGLASEVFVRDHAALAATLAANPFHDMARDDPSHLLVLFLKSDPAPADLEALRGKIQGPEQVAAGPACLYAAYPAGIGTSKLTGAIIERALGLKGTGRNWNTVTKLNELTT